MREMHLRICALAIAALLVACSGARTAESLGEGSGIGTLLPCPNI
jgi:hypothetical protein